MDRSGFIEFNDLTQLLGNWGNCRDRYPNAICWTDIDANRQVGFSDLTRMLIALAGGNPSCPLPSAPEGGSSGPSSSSASGGALGSALVQAWLEAGGDAALTAGTLDVESVATTIMGGDFAGLFELIDSAEGATAD